MTCRLAVATCFVGIVILLIMGCRQSRENTALPQLFGDIFASDPELGPASTNATIIKGELPAEDLRSIAALVGRIPKVDHKIQTISTAWGVAPVAVRVQIPHYVLYLVKTRDRGWEISAGGFEIGDSW